MCRSEEKEIVSGVVIIVGVVTLGLIVFGYLKFQHYSQQKLIKCLKLQWGKESTKEYNYNDFQNIKTYWALKSKMDMQSGGYIDEVTWNDLDMDEVFLKINHTESIIGENYLYNQLHCLRFDISELKASEKLIDYMDKNEETRLSNQMALNKFGKGVNNRIPTYLFRIDEKSSYYKPLYSVIGVLPLISLVSLLGNVKIGLILLGITVGVNAYIHLKHAHNLAYEMEVIRDIHSMLKVAKKISQIKDEELKLVCNTLEENYLKFKSILNIEGRFFLSTNTDVGILQEYAGIITLSQIRIYHKYLTLLKKEVKALQNIYETLGRVEASIAIASYRRSVEYWSTPIYTGAHTIEVEDMYHPLIIEPVPNSVKLTKDAIITGSNASGKSTFVKSLAINGILAQSIHTVLATKFIAPLSYYMTSMAISDSISASESYYIAEIRSLKRIIDTINKYPFCVCFIDEILKGTNTIERIAASASILKHLSLAKCLCLVASHDIELTQMMEDSYENYHFCEIVDDSEIWFDYKIHKGPSTTRNAIKLLELMKYNESIIYDANRLAVNFTDNQLWLKP